MLNLPLQLVIDGNPATADTIEQPLIRAAIISLFTWRRADADDKLPAKDKYGWWGDSFPVTTGDKIGSRLWLLSRSPLTDEAVLRAKSYAEEALEWLIEDGIAAAVIIQAERQGLDRLAISVLIIRGDQTALNIRFSDVWNYLC